MGRSIQGTSRWQRYRLTGTGGWTVAWIGVLLAAYSGIINATDLGWLRFNMPFFGMGIFYVALAKGPSFFTIRWKFITDRSAPAGRRASNKSVQKGIAVSLKKQYLKRTAA